MTHEAAHAAGKIAALAMVNVPSVLGAVTETTWLAAGTFVLTLGGAIQVLYKMKIDADKDETKQELKNTKTRVDVLETALKEAKTEAKEAKDENAKLVADAKAEQDAEIIKLRRRAHVVEGTQDLILGTQDAIKQEQRAMKAEIEAVKPASSVQDVRVVNTTESPAEVHFTTKD